MVCGAPSRASLASHATLKPIKHNDRHALSSPSNTRPATTLLPLCHTVEAQRAFSPALSTPHGSTPPWPQVKIFGSFDISASRSSCWLPSNGLYVYCVRVRFRELRGSCRRAAWVVRAAADPECRVFVNRGGRFVIFCYCKPKSALIHTLRDRRGRHGLDTLGRVNALNRLTPLTLGLTTLTPCALAGYCLRLYQ